jgi:hypothetical protein
MPTKTTCDCGSKFKKELEKKEHIFHSGRLEYRLFLDGQVCGSGHHVFTSRSAELFRFMNQKINQLSQELGYLEDNLGKPFDS